MPRIVPISKALQEVKRVEGGWPTGAAQQMRVILFAPRDKACPEGPWGEREVPALDIRRYLQKGYLKEMPRSGIGESFPEAEILRSRSKSKSKAKAKPKPKAKAKAKASA